jgi:2-dehydro-3-deoxyphosphooctonate aldolase (KDO 8-P synthase)
MSETRSIPVGDVIFGGTHPLALIAGPCVIESREGCLDLAGALVQLAQRDAIPLVFKASYDKANRTSHRSYRGPGLDRGLEILAEVREQFKVPVLTDVHSPEDARAAARVVDILQIPAFLSRQTDLLIAAGESGKVVNIKKAQFMAPEEIRHAVAKVESTGNRRILLTERGTTFGYNNLVADMRNLLIMRGTGYPVIFDATHSVQRPGAAGDHSGGDGRWAPALARAAVATGCDGVFIETHRDPEQALSDKENAIPFSNLPDLWYVLNRIDRQVNSGTTRRQRT